MQSKVIILGSGASGKDFLSKRFQERGFVKSVSYTTRPKREGEIDGVDYHYISEEEFHRMTQQDMWHEMDCYRGWYYGSTKADFEKCNLFIKTPEGMAKMNPKDRARCFVLFLDIPEEVRRKRLEERNDSDSVERRLEADRKAFDNYSDYDLKIEDPKF